MLPLTTQPLGVPVGVGVGEPPPATHVGVRASPEATGGACPPLGSHPNTLKFESSFFDPITNWEKGFGTVDGVIVL